MLNSVSAITQWKEFSQEDIWEKFIDDIKSLVKSIIENPELVKIVYNHVWIFRIFLCTWERYDITIHVYTGDTEIETKDHSHWYSFISRPCVHWIHERLKLFHEWKNATSEDVYQFSLWENSLIPTKRKWSLENIWSRFNRKNQWYSLPNTINNTQLLHNNTIVPWEVTIIIKDHEYDKKFTWWPFKSSIDVDNDKIGIPPTEITENDIKRKVLIYALHNIS